MIGRNRVRIGDQPRPYECDPTTGEPFCPTCDVPMATWRNADMKTSENGMRYGFQCPRCKYILGAKPNGELMSTAADQQTRSARADAHRAFDALWISARFLPVIQDILTRTGRNRRRVYKRLVGQHRRHCYAWLAEQLGIPEPTCHFGNFNLGQCRTVIAVCEGMTDQTIWNWWQGRKGQ